MSTTIDERVVEMRFDNKQFESNVSTSMSTLKKLKESLKFTGATKGLEEVDAASKRVNMSGLGGAVDTVKAKFSALDVVAVTALSNITNQAVNAGKRMISALTIDPITTGFKEYETQINAVQTILANTSAKGTTIDQVNDALDELNKYADLTIYNFTEMTRNIGTFTAAGIDLGTSVNAIQGIANLAAVSGSTSQQASTAMYQLSQALASGTVKLQDWNSVVNAGMGGEIFQNALKETSRLLGTGADEAIKASGSFRESLRKGWITSEVLTETLKKFTTSGAAEYISKFTGLTQETVDATLEATDAWGVEADAIDKAAEALAGKSGKNKDEIKATLQMAKNAQDAATKVKTFTQLWDVMKEAAQSGWSQTWRLVIGDFEEAKSLLTPLADLFTGIIGKMSDRRNNILKMTMTSGWDQVKERVKAAGGEVETFEAKVKECAKAGGVNVDDLVKKYGSLSEAFKNGAVNTKYLQDAFEGLKTGAQSTSKEVSKLSVDLDSIFAGRDGEKKNKLAMWDDDTESIKKLQTALVELGYPLKKYGVNGTYGWETFLAVKEFQKAVGILHTGVVDQATLDAMKKMAGTTVEITEGGIKADATISDLLDKVAKPSGRELVFDIINNSLSGLVGIITAFREAWADAFEDTSVASGLYNILEAVKEFTDGFIMSDEATEKLKRTFSGLIAVFDIVANLVGGGVKFAFKALSSVLKGFNFSILDSTASIGDMLVALRDWITENNIFGKAFDWLLTKFESGVDSIRNWVGELFNSLKNTEAFKQFESALGDLGDTFRKFRNGEIDIFDLGFCISDFAGKVLLAIPVVRDWFDAFKESPRFQIWVDAFAELGRQVDAFRNGDIGILDLAKAFGDYVSKVLMAIPVIEKWVNVFKGWVESFKNLPAVKQFTNAINSISEAFNKLKSGDMNFSDFGTVLGENLAKAISAIPEIIKGVAKGFLSVGSDIASDFIAGFQNGIFGKVSGVISSIVSFCINFVSAFKEALGVHSPSVKAYETASDFFQGFINGSKDAIGGVLEIFSSIGDKIVKFFNGFWEFITNESGNVDFSKIFAVGSIIGLITTVVKLANAASRFTKSLENLFGGVSGLVESAKGVLTSLSGAIQKFGKVLDGMSWDFKAKVLLKMAAAIAILVASVWLLSTIPSDKIGMLWNAVAIIVVLAGVLVGLAFAMDKMSAASVKVEGKKLNIDGLKTSLIQIAAALLLLALTVKLIGNLDPYEAKQGFLSLAGMMVALVAAVATLGYISKKSKDVDKFGVTMVKLATGLLIMAIVAKMIGKMDRGELIQGGLAMAAFSGIIVALMWATKLISGSKNVGEIGSTLIKIAGAIAIMAIVAKMLGKMDRNELIQGGLAIAAFSGVIVALMWATKLINGSKNVDTVGQTILKICAGMAVLAVAVKVLAGMSPSELLKGGVAIGALTGIIVGLMYATKLISGSKNVESIGRTLLAVSGAIAILAGIAVMLSVVGWDNFSEGALMIGILATIISGLMWATKLISGSKNLDTIGKTLLTVSGAIAILAGIAVMLGLIPTENLIKGGAAIVVLAGVMVALIAVTKLAKKCMSTLIVLTAMVAAMGGVVYLLSSLPDPKAALYSALALGGLMIAMVAVIAILSRVGKGAAKALPGIIGLAALGLVLREFVWVLSSMDGLDNASSNAKALTLLAGACTLMLGILTLVGMAFPAALAGVIGLAALGLVLREFVWVLSSMDGLDNASSNAKVLTLLMNTLGNVMAKISLLGPLAIIGEAAVLGLVSMIGVIGVLATAIGALMTKVPELQKFLDVGLTVMEQLADGIGTMIGKLIGGVIAGVSSAVITMLPQLGISLSAFMVGAAPFIAISKTVDDSVVKGAGCLAAAILVLTGASFVSGVADILGLGLPDLAVQLVLFGVAAKTFATSIDGIDTSSVDAAMNLGNMILAITASEFISGLTKLFGGSVDFSSIGTKLSEFADAVVTFSSAISGKIDTGAVEAATKAGELLVALNKSLPRSGGFLQDIIGEKDLGRFASSCKAFAECILDINAAISQNGFEIQSDKIEQLVTAGTMFSDLNNALPRSGGVAQDLAGEQDLSRFATSCSAFANAILVINEALSGSDVTIQSDKLTKLAEAGTKFNELNTALPRSGGLAQDLAGEQDLNKFATSCSAFASAMILINSAMGEAFTVNLVGIDGMVQAGQKLQQLQSVLPKSGGWWQEIAGESDIGDFGSKIQTFASSIVDFSTNCSGLDSGGISLAITAAYRIKNLIESLSDIDTSGVATFTGVGTGGIGADGPAYKIAKAINAFNTEVTNVDTSAVLESITAANRLKILINSLVGIDSSGAKDFDPESIGSALKSYDNQVKGLDSGAVSSSISAANRLKTFISSLAGLDTSGIAKFKISSIGSSLQAYGRSMSSLNSGAILSSVTAATSLRSFISSLSGLDTSGVSSFKAAVSELGTINAEAVSASLGALSSQLIASGSTMMNSLATGMQSGSGRVVSVVNSMMIRVSSRVKSKKPEFSSAGREMASAFASGISANASSASTNASSMASSAASSIKGHYKDFYNSGVNLGQGFIYGLNSKKEAAIQTAYNLGKEAAAALKRGQKEGSPSKLTIKSGKYFAQGYALGMEDDADLSVKAAESMASGAINSLKAMSASISDLAMGDVDMQPTIRPVLDLSEVKTGAAAVSGLFSNGPTVGVRSNLNAINVAMNNKLQNSASDDIVSAINKLGAGLENNRGDTYNFGDFTYDDGSEVADAVGTLIRYAKIGRRV